MHIDVIDTWADFAGVRRNWETVYDADPEAQFFLCWQWLSDWLSVHQTPWFLLAAKRDEFDAEYVAFLPLRMLTHFDKTPGFFHELMFAGTGFSDYAGILTRPECEAEALAAFAAYVKQEIKWARFTMHNLTMSDSRRRQFLGAFDEIQFAHTPIEYRNAGEPTDHGLCLSINLPARWDDYLGTLSANNRQKIRRLLRKVDGAEACRISLSDRESFDQNLTTLLNFWKVKWAPRKGVESADEIAALNHAMLTRCAANGTLFLPVFWHGDRPVAALATLVDPCKKSLLFFIAGRDESYREMPAGYLLHAYSIRHAIAQGFASYDFLKGDEPYKYLFAPQQERRQHAAVVATRAGRNLGDQLDPKALVAVLELTAEFHDRGAAADAERGYRQILEIVPDHALALYRLGRLMSDRGDHAQARELFSRSVAVEPDGDNAWLWLARSLRWLGEDQAALAACRKVIDLEPQNEEAIELIAQLSGAVGPASRSVTATMCPVMAVDATPVPQSPPAAGAEAIADPGAQTQAVEIHNQIQEFLRTFGVTMARG